MLWNNFKSQYFFKVNLTNKILHKTQSILNNPVKCKDDIILKANRKVVKTKICMVIITEIIYIYLNAGCDSPRKAKIKTSLKQVWHNSSRQETCKHTPSCMQFLLSLKSRKLWKVPDADKILNNIFWSFSIFSSLKVQYSPWYCYFKS